MQTAFTLKLNKFDDSKKVALIKEVKNIVEGLNLVQVKNSLMMNWWNEILFDDDNDNY